jgi:matrixin
MPTLRNALAPFGGSLEKLRSALGVPRPASARALLMRPPRWTCGFVDRSPIGLVPQAYGFTGLRRPTSLTYAFDASVDAGLPATSAPGAVGVAPPSPPGPQRLFTNPNVFTLIARAFSVWSRAAPAIAATYTSGDVDITFKLGQTPPNTTGLTTGDGSTVTFNTQGVGWAPQNPTAALSFLAVATHEIGHALGLGHATTPSSVMFPSNTNTEILSGDDVAAIRALYAWDSPQSLGGRGTAASPALCSCGGVLVMAWRGTGDDHNIYCASSTDGKQWTDQQLVSGAASSDGPCLAWDGTQLWLAFKGVPGDHGLYWTTTKDFASFKNWQEPVANKIPGVGSSFGPFLAMTPAPTLVWKGLEGDQAVYFSTFSGNPPWQPQQFIGGIGTTDRPTIAVDPTGAQRLVWRGVDDDFTLYTTSLFGRFWQPQTPISWVITGNGPQGTVAEAHPASAFGPVAVSTPAAMFLLWRGGGDDQRIWFTQLATDLSGPQAALEWSSQAEIPGSGTSSRPAVAFFRGSGDTAPRLYAAWKGVTGDSRIWTSAL